MIQPKMPKVLKMPKVSLAPLPQLMMPLRPLMRQVQAQSQPAQALTFPKRLQHLQPLMTYKALPQTWPLRSRSKGYAYRTGPNAAF
jgi:hypothetical protein